MSGLAVGCRIPLDVLRVDTEDQQHRFAVCVASYGYMGDLMKDSEKLRWMGPARYNISGAITLLQGRRYTARVSWLPAASQSAFYTSLYTLTSCSEPSCMP